MINEELNRVRFLMGYNKSRPLLEQERSNVQGTTKQNAGAYVGVAFEDLAQIMKDRDDKLMSGDVYTDLPPEVDNTIPPVYSIYSKFDRA